MGLFGPSWNTKFERESQQQRDMLRLEQQFTERMWNQTNDWNLAQWNRENEYNSPVNQMARMAAAGINPNNAAAAVAGNASSASALQSSAPSSPTAPSAPSPTNDLPGSILGLGSTAIDAVRTGVDAYKTINAEIPNTEANTKKTQAETSNVEANTLLTEEERKKVVEEIRGMKFENVHIKPAQFDNIMANTKLTQEQANETIEKIRNLQGEYELIQKSISEKEAQINILKEQVNYWKEQTKVAISEQEKNAAQVNLSNAQASLASAQEGLVDEQKAGQKATNQIRQELIDLGADPDEHNPIVAGTKTAAVNAARLKKKRDSGAFRSTSHNHTNPTFHKSYTKADWYGVAD